jgi:signal transduction histidine kinase
MIATGRLRLNLEALDLAESAREVVERFQETAARAGCDLTIETEGSVMGTWDRLRVEQILTGTRSPADTTS